jgi:hypothetical protein
MAWEQKNDEGALFKNDKRETETHPHYKGYAQIGGCDYWISAWVNDFRGKAGKWMALKFKPKDAPPVESESWSAPEVDQNGVPF